MNEAPQLDNFEPMVAHPDQLLEFDAHVTDSDLPTNILGYTLENAPSGATIGLFDGHFKWTPTISQAGQSYQFKIVVTDNGEPSLATQSLVTIAVSPSGANSPVEGKITLQDWKIRPAGQKVTFEVRNTLGVPVEVIKDVELGPHGSYSFSSTLVGTYALAVKGLTWLSAIRYPVELGSAAAKVGFTLINGDVDGDDYVGTDDYLRLSQAFDSSVGDGNYDRNADLDGDGYVGTDDYLILNKNFDQQGM